MSIEDLYHYTPIPIPRTIKPLKKRFIVYRIRYNLCYKSMMALRNTKIYTIIMVIKTHNGSCISLDIIRYVINN
jgi:hypothetical protein